MKLSIRLILGSRFRDVVTMTTVTGSLILSGVIATNAQEKAHWSVPVRVFSDSPSREDEPAVAMPQRQAKAISALPPQYDTTRRMQGDREPPASDARLRFIISLVERPILVEAKVTIDGKPFRMRREERIDKLREGLSQVAPPADPAAPEVPSSEIRSASPPGKPTTPSKPAVDNSITTRLRRYASSVRRSPSRDELRWLLTNWGDGPTLLFLDQNYQRVRAGASPLFKLLDRDADQVISSEEIAASEKTLWKYDADQDEVLSLSEIVQSAEQTSGPVDEVSAIPPLIPLEQLLRPQMFRQLRDYYQSNLPRLDPDQDTAVSEAELAELRGSVPDLVFQVAFDTQDPARSRLELLAAERFLEDQAPTVREASLTLFSAGTLLELSAVQSQYLSDIDQVSLGAVRDGYPLLPEIDANEDGRLTIRELRAVPQSLITFDRNHDGQISRKEIPPTLRLSIGCGPIVHRHLATVRSVHPMVVTATVSPPEWFVRMDRNHDGDLTPREFLGGQEQFASLDSDHDDLISPAEATAKAK